jgi:choline dehydrogenase-like flavoprotein
MQGNKFDAIVIGSGISGGWAAKELCEKGLKTLVLEKGRPVVHVKDYPTANLDAWDMEFRGALTQEEAKRFPVQTRSGFVGGDNKHFFTDDLDNPYIETQRFDWIRGNQTGGRSLTWGRNCYRWSDLDFEANKKDGIAIDWPIRYQDIEPWYTYVEKFAGISGEKLGLSHLPDGYFLPPIPLNCIEQHLKKEVEGKFKGRHITPARVAHLTDPQPWHLELGRGKCMNRDRCARGCPFGAYFSSNSATLPAASRTGNLTLRHHALVHSILYDEKTSRATGVRVIDAETMNSTEYEATLVFCCASTLATTQILMNSVSSRFPNGLGNDSGQLGRNLMDHHYRCGAYGEHEGYADQYYKGRKPTGLFIPRYVNLDKITENKNFIRGYDYQGAGGTRNHWSRGINEPGVGAEFKESLFKPGGWNMGLMGFGECLPYAENRVSLDPEKKDKWGLPLLVIDAGFRENEMKMREQIKADAAEMLEVAGFKNVRVFDEIGGMGVGVHEMGTARMGRDPKTSVLNGNNQVHSVPNVFVTDGACMTSASCVNPSITYMALTARAVDFALKALNKRNL